MISSRHLPALMVFMFATLSVFADPMGLTLSPAAISLKGKPGHSYTQTITIKNSTATPLIFHLEAEDVVVEAGKRKFVPAGQVRDGAAQYVKLPDEPFRLQPGADSSVPVTFVMPPATGARGVAVFFVSEPFGDDQRTKVRIRLGAVIDFTISDAISLNAAEPVMIPPTATANAVVTQALDNVGTEPVIAKGMAAILDASGHLVGKASFAQRRLFPGEHDAIRAEYAGVLPPGRYRVLCTLAFGGKSSTKTIVVDIP